MQNSTAHLSYNELPPEQLQESPEAIIKQIQAISLSEYGRFAPQTDKLIDDVQSLFNGDWPMFQQCQVGYHTIDHSLAVTLATARMISGWNRKYQENQFSETLFSTAIAAALFHDTGYLKDQGDQVGKGGKYTFNHVVRSIEIAQNYLAENNWPADLIAAVGLIIQITEFSEKGDFTLFDDQKILFIAKMVGSADIIAQMSDINYIRRLHDLHTEFLEAYDIEGRESLQQRNIHIYESFDEILASTPDFYENYVLPRLRRFGRMDQYLVSFFADGRNPYFENITANITGQLLNSRVKWQRLGDILLELKLVQPEIINQALTRQKQLSDSLKAKNKASCVKNDPETLLHWLKGQTTESSRLGDILIQMSAVQPNTLRTGLLSQLLPDELINQLSRNELLVLLQISLLAQNLYDAPWVFEQILQMAVELLQSQAGSVLLADQEKERLLVAIHYSVSENEQNTSYAIDKGLPGWVFRHAQTAFVNKGVLNNHFLEESLADGDLDSILAVPLYSNGSIIGVVELVNKKRGHFNAHDADILTLVANVIASSLSQVGTLLETC